MAGTGTEVELNQQKPQKTALIFPGLPKTISGERTQQELTQVNMDGHDQGGGGSSRNQIRGIRMEAQADCKNVGVTKSYNGPRQGGLDVSSIILNAGERAENVGIHNVGNTGPDEGSSHN